MFMKAPAPTRSTVVAPWDCMSPSTVPVLVHHFASVEDARAAARSAPDGVRLRVPCSLPVQKGQTVVLLFRAGQGSTFQATGRAEAVDKVMGIATLGFRGYEALVIDDALERSAYPHQPRKFARYRCWDAVSLRTQNGRVIRGVVCDVAVGGIRVTLLSDQISAGEPIQVDFGKGGRSVPARVQWSLAPSAGLEFMGDPASMPLVRRIVSEAAAHAEPGWHQHLRQAAVLSPGKWWTLSDFDGGPPAGVAQPVVTNEDTPGLDLLEFAVTDSRGVVSAPAEFDHVKLAAPSKAAARQAQRYFDALKALLVPVLEGYQ